MGSASHQLCPRYSGTLTSTAPTAIRLWETFTFTYFKHQDICTVATVNMMKSPDEVGFRDDFSYFSMKTLCWDPSLEQTLWDDSNEPIFYGKTRKFIIYSYIINPSYLQQRKLLFDFSVWSSWLSIKIVSSNPEIYNHPKHSVISNENLLKGMMTCHSQILVWAKSTGTSNNHYNY